LWFFVVGVWFWRFVFWCWCLSVGCGVFNIWWLVLVVGVSCEMSRHKESSQSDRRSCWRDQTCLINPSSIINHQSPILNLQSAVANVTVTLHLDGQNHYPSQQRADKSQPPPCQHISTHLHSANQDRRCRPGLGVGCGRGICAGDGGWQVGTG
jgi:hypothetical protein